MELSRPLNGFLTLLLSTGHCAHPSFSRDESDCGRGDTDNVGVVWDALVLDFSFVKLDILRCYGRASSGQWFPED